MYEKIVVENSNLAHGMGALDLEKFEPFPKNPSISKVFREIGLADELGSGMRNTYKYTRLYSGKDPIFEEIKEAIVEAIKNDKYISRKKIGERLGYSEKTISEYIQEIGNIRYVGRGKAGYWEIEE